MIFNNIVSLLKVKIPFFSESLSPSTFQKLNFRCLDMYVSLIEPILLCPVSHIYHTPKLRVSFLSPIQCFIEILELKVLA